MLPIVSPIFLHLVAHVVYLSPCPLLFVHHPPLQIIYSTQRITRDNKIPNTKSKCMVITISKVTLGDGSIRISLVCCCQVLLRGQRLRDKQAERK